MSMSISIKNGKADTVCRVTRIFRAHIKNMCNQNQRSFDV